MKLTLIAVALVSLLLVHETESGWIRFRRIGRAIARAWKPACSLTCPRICTKGFLCKFGCGALCGKRKRAAFKQGVHVTRLPRNFDFYDLSDDDFVSLQEIATTLGHSVNEVDLIVAFNATDTNQDGKLTEEELLSSKVFVFADGPVEPDTTLPPLTTLPLTTLPPLTTNDTVTEP
ncbi:EF-hand calcium-binding domain-containing protein 1-like [Liolophura sinensis]|uniref:EF-hand calcium-binding domain-containing protein 1-like n=1 Tax=Liolophura sinensis TaxID=3198878 RepID=UPI0031584EC5